MDLELQFRMMKEVLEMDSADGSTMGMYSMLLNYIPRNG